MRERGGKRKEEEEEERYIYFLRVFKLIHWVIIDMHLVTWNILRVIIGKL